MLNKLRSLCKSAPTISSIPCSEMFFQNFLAPPPFLSLFSFEISPLCSKELVSMRKRVLEFQMKTNRGRFFWRFAKSKLLDCRRRLGLLRRNKTMLSLSPSAHSPKRSAVVLDEPILEEVLKRLDLKERVLMRDVSSYSSTSLLLGHQATSS